MPFWPRDLQLYLTNTPLYFAQFDAVVRSAEMNGLGLILSMFWADFCVPDLVWEPVGQWGNARSRTQAFMRNYTREVVLRYRNSPAIWGWEFGNEYNLAADLPNAADHRPPIQPSLGTPTTRSVADDLTHEMIWTAFAAFASEVRRYDPLRLISTGNSRSRESEWHQWQELSWTTDTPVQFAAMLGRNNPDPVNVLSVHLYGDTITNVPALLSLSAAQQKPLMVGEFGVPGAPSADTTNQFNAALAILETNQVPLAMVWVYDRQVQDEWNVSATNARAYQLRALRDANARIQAEGNPLW